MRAVKDEERGAYEAGNATPDPEACRFHYADEAAVIAAAQTFSRIRLARCKTVTGSRDAAEYLRLHFATQTEESMVAVWLDTRHRVVDVETVGLGTIDRTTIHVRRILRAALDRNAAAVILAHNHPSGDAEPSDFDRHVTVKLQDMLGEIDVRLVDHIVVAGDAHVSMAERGLVR